MYIADRLTQLRKSRKLSLTDISRLSGVQLATLSRIENKKMVGTLESHLRIAKVLGVDVTELYKDINTEMPPTVEAGAQDADIFTQPSGAVTEILTKNIMQKRMLPILIKLEKNGKTSKEQHNPGTEKFLFILEGTIEAAIDTQKFTLQRHHTLYFDASKQHQLKNTGKTTAKILCISTPVAL